MTITLSNTAGVIDLTDKEVDVTFTHSVTWESYTIEAMPIASPATAGQLSWTPTDDDWEGLFPDGAPVTKPTTPADYKTLFLVEFKIQDTGTGKHRKAPTVRQDTLIVYHPLPPETT